MALIKTMLSRESGFVSSVIAILIIFEFILLAFLSPINKDDFVFNTEFLTFLLHADVLTQCELHLSNMLTCGLGQYFFV